MALDRIPGDAELYVGGLFSLRRYEALKKANITHVLSTLRLPLDPELFSPYEHLVVEIDDVEDEDILQHFPSSNAFIRQGLDAGGGVLVHCAMGKSRSPAFLIAYLLSQDPSSSPEDHLSRIRQSRAIAEPNHGFMHQLLLYQQMGCPESIDTHPAYERWLYDRNVEASIACGQPPDTIRFSDEAKGKAKVGPDESEISKREFRCRKCRRSLATSVYLMSHTPKQQPSSPPGQCAHLFLEPLSWMRPELEQGKMEGRLECPNGRCKTNVGKYAWQGMRCSCGDWVVPAISLARGRIDEAKARGLGIVPGGNEMGKM